MNDTILKTTAISTIFAAILAGLIAGLTTSCTATQREQMESLHELYHTVSNKPCIIQHVTPTK